MVNSSISAISRFFNHYNWSTRSVIRFVRQHILQLILSLFPRGRKPTLQVILDLTTKDLEIPVYLHLGNNDNLDWFYSAQKALILLLPHILLLSLLKQLDTLRLWLNDQGFDFCLVRCKI